MTNRREGDADGKTSANESRRNFLKTTTLVGGAAALGTVALPFVSRAEAEQLTPRQVPLAGMAKMPGKANHWYVPASDRRCTGAISASSYNRSIEIDSGDYVTIECLTHQAGDDPARMIKGDPGAESVYHWTREQKNVDRRGAGPMDARQRRRGGLWRAHPDRTGRVAGRRAGRRARSAHPGDAAARLRQCDQYRGSAFGTNWRPMGLSLPRLRRSRKPREIVTIYELESDGEPGLGTASPQLPLGPVHGSERVVHSIYDYPGLVVDPEKIESDDEACCQT